MSFDHSAHPMASGQKIPNSWLDTIIRQNLSSIATSSQEWQTSGCLMADIGEFFVRSMADLTTLADSTVNGHHINAYTRTKLDEMDRQNDFSDLSPLDYLDEKHTALKFVSLPQLRTVI